MRVQWRKEWTTPALVGVGSFAAGVGVGFLGYRFKVDRDIERGLSAMQDFVRTTEKPFGKVHSISLDEHGLGAILKVEDPKTLEQITNDATKKLNQRKPLVEDSAVRPEVHIPSSDDLDILKPEVGPDESSGAEVEVCEIESEAEAPEEEASSVETKNIFDVEWDESDEANRSDSHPYILREEEYFADEKGYRQSVLTWYTGDEILTDENDVPIYDTSIVGDIKTLQFGRGTSSPDTLYIRNDKLKAEYELVREHTHYQVAVMGLDAEEMVDEDELRHSQRVLRFRMD